MDENPEFAAIEQARDLVIDSIAETMDLYGITRSVGILYGTMYMRDEMTLDEMREELQMSKPSMSTGVKKLASRLKCSEKNISPGHPQAYICG